MKPDSRAWLPLFTAFATLIAALVVKASGAETFWTFVIAPAIAGSMVLLLDWATPYLLNKLPIRRKIDRRAKFEGVWLEYELVNDEVKYAGFSIKYTGASDEPFLIKGDAYYSDGRKFAEWRSSRVKFDVIGNTLDYFYAGRLLGEEIDVRGFAHFSFNVSPGHLYKYKSESKIMNPSSTYDDKTSPHSGSGYLVDYSSKGMEKKGFDFIRVNNEIIKLVLGDMELQDFEIERKFIVEFHKKYGQSIKNNKYLKLDNS